MTLSTLEELDDLVNNPDYINKLKLAYKYISIKDIENYYSDPDLFPILDFYCKQFNNISFFFPIGSFQVIRYFERISHGQLLLLAADQGVSTEEQVKNWGEPKISLHGSYSIPVSYHAIAQYIKVLGGVSLVADFIRPCICGWSISSWRKRRRI